MEVNEFLTYQGINIHLITVNDFLEHHGVKGQKWGVVKREDSSAGSQPKQKSTKQDRREKRAQKYVGKAKEYQQQIDALSSQKSQSPHKQAKINDQKLELKYQKKLALDNAERKRQGKLTPTEKKLAVAATLVAAYGTYQAIQSGRAHSLLTEGKAFLSGKGVDVFKKDLRLADSRLTPEAIKVAVVGPINRDYGGIGTKMNCRRATFAYEMRRRGFDVAATRTTSGRGQDVSGTFNALHEGKDFVGGGKLGMLYHVGKENVKKGIGISSTTPFTKTLAKSTENGVSLLGDHQIGAESSEIFRSLASQPKGARGELGVTWIPGGGHSLAWENIQGKLHIFDTQSGKMFRNATEFHEEFGNNVATAAFTRLDNKELNPKFLMRWLKDA